MGGSKQKEQQHKIGKMRLKYNGNKKTGMHWPEDVGNGGILYSKPRLTTDCKVGG